MRILFIVTFLLLVGSRLGVADQSVSCRENNDCGPQGICSTTPWNQDGSKEARTCRCMYGFGTRDSGQPCNYLLKDYGTTFGLSLLLGLLGVDWFYLSDGNLTYILVGVGKLILSATAISLIIWKVKTETWRPQKSCLSIICLLAFSLTIGWWTADWIRVIANAFPDGNGYPLKHQTHKIFGVYTAA